MSIESRAAMPPNPVPYPVLVGTAMTGLSTMPPMTLGRAPSMPATTMSTAAEKSFSFFSISRWMPATPTS